MNILMLLMMAARRQSFQINQFKNDLKSHSSSRESSSDENPDGDMLSGGYG